MIKYVDGDYIKMTDEEIIEANKNEVVTEPTELERLKALEDTMLSVILGGAI